MWFSTVCLISAPRIIRQPRCMFHMQHMTWLKFSISGLCKCGGDRCNNPRRKPRPITQHRVEAATAGPDSYDPSHAFMGASPDSVTCRLARPVPLGIPLPGGSSETFRNTRTQPNQKVPLDELLCLFPSDHGDARVVRVPGGDIATARQARLVPRQHKTTADNAPTRLALFIGRGGGTHSLVRSCAMGDCGGLRLCNKVLAVRHENLPIVV